MAYARQCEECGALVYGRQEPKAVAHVCPAALAVRLAALEGRVMVMTPAPIHVREDLVDVVKRFTTTEHTTSPETQAAVDRFNAQPERWKREVLDKVAERRKRIPNHIEDTLVSLDTKRESHRPARRKRRWWRLWT